MEETRRRVRLPDFAPLPFLVPAIVLLVQASGAYSMYARGIENTAYHGRNLNETMWIGAVVWTVAAAALGFLFLMDIVLRKIGKGYKVSAAALVAAGTWNLLLGSIGFFANPFPCGLIILDPQEIPYAALYLAAITFGLLLVGIAAIKFNSIEGARVNPLLVEIEPYDFERMGRGAVRLARWMCLINGILAMFGLLFLDLSGCLID